MDDLDREIAEGTLQVQLRIFEIINTLAHDVRCETAEWPEAYMMSPDVCGLLGNPTVVDFRPVVVDVSESGWIRALVSRKCSKEPRRYEWRLNQQAPCPSAR